MTALLLDAQLTGLMSSLSKETNHCCRLIDSFPPRPPPHPVNSLEDVGLKIVRVYASTEQYHT